VTIEKVWIGNWIHWTFTLITTQLLLGNGSTCQNIKNGINYQQWEVCRICSQYIYIFIYSCCSHLEHRASVERFVSLQFLNLKQSVGFLGKGISPSQGPYLHRTTQTQNKRRQKFMRLVGFEPTIPAFEPVKTFHILDRAATVTGYAVSDCCKIPNWQLCGRS
jgi:hypothetical protein